MIEGPDPIEKRPPLMPRLVSGDISLEMEARALLQPIAQVDHTLSLAIERVTSAGELTIDDDFTRLIEPALHAAGLQRGELQGAVLDDAERAADRLSGDTDAFSNEHPSRNANLAPASAPGVMSRFDETDTFEPGGPAPAPGPAPGPEQPRPHPEPGRVAQVREAVRQVYLTLLFREPDQDGWDNWVMWILDRGMTIDWVIDRIKEHPEYFEKNPP